MLKDCRPAEKRESIHNVINEKAVDCDVVCLWHVGLGAAVFYCERYMLFICRRVHGNIDDMGLDLSFLAFAGWHMMVLINRSRASPLGERVAEVGEYST